MKNIKNILITTVVLLLAYLLLIVAIPALAMGGLFVAMFGNLALWIIVAVLIVVCLSCVINSVRKK